MIKNSILGKLCPVFHLRSAAVASLQNLNESLVWPGTGPWCDSEEEHTLVGGWIWRRHRQAIAKRGGEQHCRELYNCHKSLLHYHFFPPSASVSRSPSTHPFAHSMPPSLFLPTLHGYTSSSPHLHSYPEGSRGFLPSLLLYCPWKCALVEIPLVALNAPLSIHLSLIYNVVGLHSFFIDLLFCCLAGI